MGMPDKILVKDQRTNYAQSFERFSNEFLIESFVERRSAVSAILVGGRGYRTKF